MKIYPLIAALIVIGFALPAQAAKPSFNLKYYKYSHYDGEYSVLLPEAPQVETIWSDSRDIPYLEGIPPEEGAIGEIATFKRVDIDTEDSFDVKIVFLKATSAFLQKLNQKKMQTALEYDFVSAGVRLDNRKFEFLDSKENSLKWAILTGYTVDKNNHLFFNAAHYLVGQQSILVIKVQYNVENKLFEQYYKKLSQNVTYQAP